MQDQITIADGITNDIQTVGINKQLKWTDFIDSVIMTTVELTGELVPVDDIPLRAIRWHYNCGNSAYVAAGEIIREDRE